MSYPRKATDEQIVEAYEITQSIWKAAELLGMCGQSVHERLVKLGFDTSQNVFTDEDAKYLSERYVPYRNAGQLQVLADEMGRTKQFICRKAGELGLTDKNCPRKYLRVWKDMPREVVQPIWDDFKKSRFCVSDYCKRKSYDNMSFTDCMRRNFPKEYDSVVASKTPKSSKYKLGRDFEYEVVKHMTKHGYIALRSPASKSPADIYCMKLGELVFIQCKRSGSIGVDEWNTFMDYSTSVGAVPVMAEKVPGGIAYHELTAKKDRSRRRQPMKDWEPSPSDKETK